MSCKGTFKVMLGWRDAPALELSQPRREEHIHEASLQPSSVSWQEAAGDGWKTQHRQLLENISRIALARSN